MSKRLVFESEARAGILKGIELLGQAVETTYGYNGPCVMVQHRARGLPPVFTRDGVTVANALVLKDGLAEIGARMLRDVANAVSRQAGDGTTTAVVLARAIAGGLLRSLAVGADPLRLRDGMETAVQLAIATLQRHAEPAVGDRLAAVANVSMRGEGSVAGLMQQAYTELGTDGIVNVEASWTGIDRIDFNEGFRYEQGLLSPMLITDEVRRIAELENVRVLLYHGTVQDFMDLVPVLESVRDSGQSLALVCEGVDERPLQTLVMNVHRGVFQAIAVKAPGIGDRTGDWLDDLALTTGARVLVPQRGDRLEAASDADLGHCSRVNADVDTATFIDGVGNHSSIAARIQGLRSQADEIRARKPGHGSPTGNLHDLEDLEARIAALDGRIATVFVGGSSEAVVKERLQRAENARRSVRAALEEGVVPGGGVALVHAQSAVSRLSLGGTDRQSGAAIVSAALMQPFRRLMTHAGLNPDAALAEVRAAGDPWYGYDAAAGTFCDLLDAGVLDTTKVLRMALRQAVGVAGTVLASGAVVLREKSGLPDLPGFSAEWAAATREDPRA